jgi:hypothetical protein
MGKVYEEIDETLREFIRAQQMFFVATGPLTRIIREGADFGRSAF